MPAFTTQNCISLLFISQLPESHQLAVLLSEQNIVRMDQIRIDGNGFSVQEQRLKQLIALTRK